MSTTRKGAKFLALLAGGSLALTACTSGGGDDPEAGGDETEGSETQDITITVAHEQEYGSYNNNTAAENAVKNTVILNQVLRGFWFYGEDGNVTPDTEFGTYEQTSEDPLTVQYSFAEGAVWSDGEAIDCDDMLLTWAAHSGTYTAGDAPLFEPASTTGYELMNKPECADGDTEVEIVYNEPFADWAAMFGGSEILPAHVVEEQAGGIDIVDAVTNDDIDALTSAAEFWQTGWVQNPGEIDPELTPSAGPYVLDSWQAGQSITLVANESWWGTPPAAGTITVRIIEQDQQAQALANNEIQIAEPQPNPDVINQLEGLGDAVEVVTGDEYTYEHWDFNFDGPFADPVLREAFALCAPRQQIVDNLIVPVNPNAEVQNIRNVMNLQTNYDEIVAEAYDGRYDEVDVEGAAALLEEAGAVGQTVRIGYQAPNPRRTNQVDLLRDSCNEAGFDIQDAGQEDFFGNGLDNGNFDIAMFAWAGSPLVSGWASTYITDGGNNNGNYSNPEIDSLVATLNVTPDEAEQNALITQIETILWEDLATIPVFGFPGVVAYGTDVQNVKFQPSQTQITWNMQEWTTGAQ